MVYFHFLEIYLYLSWCFQMLRKGFLSIYWWQLQSTGSVYSATENRTEQLNWNMDVKFKSLSQGCAFCCIIYLLSGSLPEVDMWLLFIESRCRAARRGKLRWLRWTRAFKLCVSFSLLIGTLIDTIELLKSTCCCCSL